jgi:BirA family biotin operon repressor/biotin-[acetyl-CoA-carboxylase] ligase
MHALTFPAILDALAQAGDAGVAVIDNDEFREGLQQCREWGFNLKTEADRVRLCRDPDQLVPAWIEEETPAIAWDSLSVKGFLRLESTNSVALKMALQGAPGGTLILAEEQTEGRGRKDRTWFSQRGAGLCCTLIVRPGQMQKHWPLLTLAASVALVDALKDLVNRAIIPVSLDIDIKWPNDVLLSGRKCAGILLETIMTDVRNPSAVVGFGINVRKENVPGSLASEAVSLDEMAGVLVPRRQILVRFLHYFQLGYVAFEQGKHQELLQRWKEYSSMWDGVSIWIGDGPDRRKAITCGLTESGALRVRGRNGKLETVIAESVRIAGNSKGNHNR